MNEIPQSISSLMNASAAFAMVCVALFVVYKRMTKTEDEKNKLLMDRGDNKEALEALKKLYEDKLNEINNKLNEILYRK